MHTVLLAEPQRVVRTGRSLLVEYKVSVILQAHCGTPDARQTDIDSPCPGPHKTYPRVCLMWTEIGPLVVSVMGASDRYSVRYGADR